MARQSINLGTTANDGTGDTLRIAMDKINDNFIELYNNGSQNISVGNTSIVNSELNGNISIETSGTGTVQTVQGLLVNTGFENSDSIFYALDGSSLVTIDVQNKRVGINKETPTSTLDVTGTASFSGNVISASSATFGSSSTDRLTINSKVFGNLIPGLSSSVGSSSERWSDVYADAANITNITVANVTATRVTATEFAGGFVGTLTTSGDIRINNGILATRINTETLTGSRSVNFPDRNGTVVVKHNGRVSGTYGQAPVTSIGEPDDKQGDIAFDDDYIYYCTADYDGSTAIWKRTALSTW